MCIIDGIWHMPPQFRSDADTINPDITKSSILLGEYLSKSY